jgi:hypothetical protein
MAVEMLAHFTYLCKGDLFKVVRRIGKFVMGRSTPEEFVANGTHERDDIVQAFPTYASMRYFQMQCIRTALFF